jgi:hypothetical protein
MKYYLEINEQGHILSIRDVMIEATNFTIVPVDSDYLLYEFINEINSMKTDTNFKLKVLRSMRDKKLLESDSLYIEAETKNIKVQDVKSYKQALRDLPDNVNIENTSLENLITLFPIPPNLLSD